MPVIGPLGTTTVVTYIRANTPTTRSAGDASTSKAARHLKQVGGNFVHASHGIILNSSTQSGVVLKSRVEVFISEIPALAGPVLCIRSVLYRKAAALKLWEMPI
ncbi:hypothetical protein FHG87_015569 [Trinorchestia longiramus]|nr:hypothetical protein FHG87_015569 [Trinorchestia longiramus]